MKYTSQPTNKDIHIGDIWVCKFNFIENGNMGKLRPVLIKNFDDENELIEVQMITTKPNKYFNKAYLIPFKLFENEERKSYLVDRYKKVPRYYLYRRIKSNEIIRKYKLDENFKRSIK